MRRFEAVLRVVGVGGAGGNAVLAMAGSGLSGVDLLAANTDAQALAHFSRLTQAPTLRLGETLTRGLGAGGRPSVGCEAAEASTRELHRMLKGADLVFVTAGMGGGTGTGAAPVVAEIARELGALTIGVVTTPFGFEGRKRRMLADQGLAALLPRVDALLTIANDRLLEAEGGDMDLAAAFRRADRVLSDGVRGIADLVTQPGLVNLDLADVRSILTGGGEALLGLGEATAREGGVLTAVQRAIHSPLLTSADVDGARSWLLNVSAGPELKLRDVEAAAQTLESAAHPDADVAFGVVSDPSLAGRARVTVVATRFEPVVEEPRRPRNALVMLPTRP
ncbi:MAG: cell division protein FtsZ [Sandaracinus sp.]|nr:cell division protein FtsZ [Sandaracinus sp.]MCB9624325.1 cell division protein FtsZ [Sandaracinus sp.]MCB9636494.1 cell division protein FtsZ [Sandaracinus sp.]